MGPTGKPLESEGVTRYSVAHFLVALLILFVTVPFVDGIYGGQLLESILMTLVLLSAVVAVGGRRRTLIVGLMLVAPAVVSKWLDHVWPHHMRHQFTQAFAIIFLSFVVLQLFRYILRAPQVNSEVLCAAIATYLLLGLTWAFAFAIVAGLNPDAFAYAASEPVHSVTGFRALYFSFMTLTTVGYGDIVPVSNIARMLAMIEATAGMFFATILIARLVAIHATNATARQT